MFFFLATLDLRQPSDQHELVVAEQRPPRIEGNYSALDEDTARPVAACSTMLGGCKASLALPYSDKTFEPHLKPLREALTKFAARPCATTSFRTTESVSDPPKWRCLLKETGLLRGHAGWRGMASDSSSSRCSRPSATAHCAGHHA